MKATTSTVSTPERYGAVRAFGMPGDSADCVASVLRAAGMHARVCKRGGLRVTWPGGAIRLTDEPGAPPLTLKTVASLIDEVNAKKHDGRAVAAAGRR
jgi:hypothetical protein